MRVAIVFPIAILCFWPVAPVAAAERFVSSTVVLQAEASDGQIETGAGVIVAADGSRVNVISAAHIFRKTTLGAAGFFGPGNVVVGVTDILSVQLNTSDDLALVTIARPAEAAFSVASMTAVLPSVGDALTVVGHPNGHMFFSSSATVISTSIADDGFALRCDTCAPGDSGGGIFNTQGQLTGILLGRTSFVNSDGDTLLTNAIYSAPAPALAAFLSGF